MIHRQDPQESTGVTSRSVAAKVCAIVLAVSDKPEQSISEVARHTGLPVSTTHRLLYELVEGGLLERSPAGERNPAGRFAVCFELQPLRGPVRRAAHARSVVGNVLEDLCHATRLRARFGVWHPNGVSYLERQPGVGQDLCVSGLRVVPTHATAMGKAMLAYAPAHVITSIVRRGLPAYTAFTLTTAEQLRNDVIRTRANMFAVSRGEWRTDEFAIATPVLGPDGAVVGALELMSDELANRARSPGPALVIAARSLARQLAADPSILPTGSGDVPLQWRADPTDATLSWAMPGEVG